MAVAVSRKILIVTSELAPFAKTGGLADMAAALADHLKAMGHEVRVVLPYYACVKKSGIQTESVLDSMCVWMGQSEIWCSVRSTKTRGGVPVLLIEQDAFFDRQGLYHDAAYNDYYDNPSRFGFFSRAALQASIDTGFEPDVVQINDWQSAPVAAYLKIWYWNHPTLGKAACALTIHNVAYQGTYDAGNYRWLGFHPGHLVPDIFEDFGRLNLLKGGIHYADVVNTVSPTHAKEITAPHGGFGLAPYLTNKGDCFKGILNGVDYADWSPENDKLIPAQYSLKNMKGKAVCKAELQKTFGLAPEPNTPVIGLVGRLAAQKGLSLVRDVIEWAVQGMHVQFAVLGSGDPDLEVYFAELTRKYPGKIGAHIGFNNGLAHLVEAGSDFFLMPSLYEPCGLNQMYSLRYGTLPIVRATGGLEDTVENYDEAAGTGTGFKFWDPTQPALYFTIGWAVSTYYDRKHHMKQLIENAMKKDFGWDATVKEYLAFFEQAIAAKKAFDEAHRI